MCFASRPTAGTLSSITPETPPPQVASARRLERRVRAAVSVAQEIDSLFAEALQESPTLCGRLPQIRWERILDTLVECGLQPRPGPGLEGDRQVRTKYLVRVLAQEIGHRKVTVDSPVPGPIVGAVVLADSADDDSYQKRLLDTVPMGRLATALRWRDSLPENGLLTHRCGDPHEWWFEHLIDVGATVL